MEFTVTPEVLIALVVAGFALFFDYFPYVAQKFDAAKKETKRLITVTIAILVGVVVFAGQCYGFFVTNLSCTVASLWDLLYGVILAVAIMYGFHAGTKPVK